MVRRAVYPSTGRLGARILGVKHGHGAEHWARLMGGAVPLSEHEQRQLEQIEQSLYADHPRLARAMRAKDPRVHYRRRVLQASLGFLIAFVVLVALVRISRRRWLGEPAGKSEAALETA